MYMIINRINSDSPVIMLYNATATCCENILVAHHKLLGLFYFLM